MFQFVQELTQSLLKYIPGSTNMATQFYSPDRHFPSPHDVVEVKQELLSRIHLPLELIDTIIDYAEYWPRTVTTRGSVIVASGRDENRFLVREAWTILLTLK